MSIIATVTTVSPAMPQQPAPADATALAISLASASTAAPATTNPPTAAGPATTPATVPPGLASALNAPLPTTVVQVTASGISGASGASNAAPSTQGTSEVAAPAASVPADATTVLTTAVAGLGKHSSDQLPHDDERQSDSSSNDSSSGPERSSTPSVKNDDSGQFIVSPGTTPAHQTEVTSTYAASANPPASVDPQSVVAQTALGVADSLSSHQEIRIKLSPPELGELQIDVAQQNGVLTARLESQSQATHHLLLDNLPNLKDTLAQQGINLQWIDVVLNEDSGRQANSGSAGAFQQSGGQQDRTPQPYVPAAPQLAPADPASIAGAQPAFVTSSSPSTGPLKQLDIKV